MLILILCCFECMQPVQHLISRLVFKLKVPKWKTQEVFHLIVVKNFPRFQKNMLEKIINYYFFISAHSVIFSQQWTVLETFHRFFAQFGLKIKRKIILTRFGLSLWANNVILWRYFFSFWPIVVNVIWLKLFIFCQIIMGRLCIKCSKNLLKTVNFLRKSRIILTMGQPFRNPVQDSLKIKKMYNALCYSRGQIETFT